MGEFEIMAQIKIAKHNVTQSEASVASELVGLFNGYAALRRHPDGVYPETVFLAWRSNTPLGYGTMAKFYKLVKKYLPGRVID